MGNEQIITRRQGRIGSEASAAAASTLPATSSALDAAVARAIAEATSANTRRAYRAQAGVFAEWCAANRVGALPASPETAARYLTARGTAGAKVATIHAARSAISALHRAAGVANPVESETECAHLVLQQRGEYYPDVCSLATDTARPSV